MMSIITDPNTFWVLTGSILLGFVSGVIGSFTYLRRQALVGDVIAHSALPGLTFAFLLLQQRSLPVLLSGAVVSSLMAYVLILLINRYTRIKSDSALAIVLSLFFAAGIFQLVVIQKMPLAAQSGIDSFLFGKAAALIGQDVVVLLGLACLILIFSFCFQRQIKYISFDPVFCKVSGVRLWLYETILALVVIITVAICMQLIGVVLVAAMLLTPAASARYWSNKMSNIILLAGMFGGLAGVLGTVISIMAPRMPTGPWIVICCTLIFLISMLFAPNRGIIAATVVKRRQSMQIDDENLLRSIYLFKGEGVYIEQFIESGLVLKFREMSPIRFEASLKRLANLGLIVRSGSLVRLTHNGWNRAELLTRFHRLWESYLQHFTEIESDHVHGDAERIEHILDQELIDKLLIELGSPQLDPHGKIIPNQS